MEEITLTPRQRLEYLACVLELPTLKEIEPGLAQFDLTTFRTNHGCGTNACALGIAEADPILRFQPNGGPQWGAYFGIKEFQADRLFMPDHYSKEEHHDRFAVARRIRSLLAGEWS